MAFSRIDFIWLALSLATAITWWIGDSGRGGVPVVAFVFALAVAKGSAVILEFMELNHAPALWRRLVLGWLLLVAAAILLIFSIGTS